MNLEIARRRLDNQLIAGAALRRPEEVVSWHGAVQAQEYDPAKWALGLRMQDGTLDADVERAFDEGRILRTHVMRPTWHFVAPADIRWLLELTAPRVQKAMSSYNRQLELDPRTLTRGTAVLERSLRDGHYLTRTELGDRLQEAGLRMAGQRLAHLVMYAELERVICSGPRRGKQFTYALLAERAPGASDMARDEALGTLSGRFLRSHGPATIRDFVWWSGLMTADARRGFEVVEARCEEVDGLSYWTVRPAARREVGSPLVHLLPIYDEYLVAYRDRDAVPHGPSTLASRSGGSVTFRHALVVDGQVAGTWRTARQAGEVSMHAVPLRPFSRAERRALTDAVLRYERFLSLRVELTFA